ncbi:MAG: type II toxin-antitoxin system RelE/ParE family toxin [Elusimicrobiota bacterium]|nr:type II toxin-antitoxin system RelE/ParE family toxin [Elusimicrobiota bacterium]
MKISWTRLALTDLESAHRYIAEENPPAAARIVKQIKTALQAISRHPEIGRPGRVAGTRELIVSGTPFILPYRIKVKRIEVLALIHGARRWPDEL